MGWRRTKRSGSVSTGPQIRSAETFSATSPYTAARACGRDIDRRPSAKCRTAKTLATPSAWSWAGRGCKLRARVAWGTCCMGNTLHGAPRGHACYIIKGQTNLLPRTQWGAGAAGKEQDLTRSACQEKAAHKIRRLESRSPWRRWHFSTPPRRRGKSRLGAADIRASRGSQGGCRWRWKYGKCWHRPLREVPRLVPACLPCSRQEVQKSGEDCVALPRSRCNWNVQKIQFQRELKKIKRVLVLGD